MILYIIISVTGFYDYITLWAVRCTVMCWHECVSHPVSLRAKRITWWEALRDIAPHDSRVWSALHSHVQLEQSGKCISERMAQLATMHGQHSIASGISSWKEVLACTAQPPTYQLARSVRWVPAFNLYLGPIAFPSYLSNWLSLQFDACHHLLIQGECWNRNDGGYTIVSVIHASGYHTVRI